MYAEKAIGLIKELDRNRDSIPPYNNDLITEVNKEVCQLFNENLVDAQTNEETRHSGSIDDVSYIPTVRIRHVAIKRNLRCLLAYHYNRLESLRKMRWEFGSILPAEIKANLSPSETAWFTKYSGLLAKYMRSIGSEGINLAVDLKPPKNLFAEVLCLVDFGNYELSDGTVLVLKKNSRHYLPRKECEELIRQGVLQHIVD